MLTFRQYYFVLIIIYCIIEGYCISLENMSNLQEIERAVSQLSPEELTAFRNWFAEFDAEVWDREFENDVAAGRLDDLAAKALQHLRAGNCTDL
jgi:hypothetical protein